MSARLIGAIFGALIALAAHATTVPITFFSSTVVSANDCSSTANGGASLISWYDASNAGSITSSGGVISQVNDLSGHSHTWTQTGGNQPTYVASGSPSGKYVFSFDPGSSQYFNVASPVTGGTYTLVVTYKAWFGYLEMFGNNTAPKGASLEGAGGLYYVYTSSGGTGGYYSFSSPAYESTNWHLMVVTVNGTSASTLQQDNGTVYNGTFSSYNSTSGWSTFGLADGLYANLYVGEVCLYSSVLNSTQIGNLYTLLHSKWGTP